MFHLKKYQKSSTQEVIASVERFNVTLEEGLNDAQIALRQKQKLTNKTKKQSTKSYFRIIKDNVLTLFNILLFVIAGLLIYAGAYTSLFFLVILFLNMAIGLYQDIKARKLVEKLKIVISPDIEVIRNGQKIKINVDDIVLDDIIILSSGLQIPCDSEVLEGLVNVDESLLTGESKAIKKEKGDELFAGAYIRSGSCYAKKRNRKNLEDPNQKF